MNAFITTYLEPFSYFIYALTLWLHYLVHKSSKIKVLLAYYVLATLLMAYASWALYHLKNTAQNNNNWIYNLFYFLSIFFLSFYMHRTLVSAKYKMVTIGLLAVNIINFFLNDLIFKRQLFDSFVSSIAVLSLIVLIFLYYRQTLANVSEQNILLSFDFWLISGYLIYYLGSFFIIISWSRLSSKIVGEPTYEQGGQFNILWSLHNILLFISAAITLIGNLWIQRYQKTSR